MSQDPAHDHSHGHSHGHGSGHSHEHSHGAADLQVEHGGHTLGAFAGPLGMWIGVFILWALGTGIVVALFWLLRGGDPSQG